MAGDRDDGLIACRFNERLDPPHQVLEALA
jgi:hypothetical protein